MLLLCHNIFPNQGGSIIRAARRMADYVGFDPETGLLTPEKPKAEKDPFILEDGKKNLLTLL